MIRAVGKDYGCKASDLSIYFSESSELMKPSILSNLLLSLLFFTIMTGAASLDRFDRITNSYQYIVAEAGKKSDAERLKQFFDLYWEFNMREYPTRATSVGFPGQNHRWADYSLESINSRKGLDQYEQQVLNSIDLNALSETDRLNHKLFSYQLGLKKEGRAFPNEFLVIDQLWGLHAMFVGTFLIMPKRNVKDFDNILVRLEGIPKIIDQNIVLMKKGLELNITLPQIALRDVPAQIRAQITDNPEEAPLLKWFEDFPKTVSENDQQKIKERAAEIYSKKVKPAMEDLLAFVENTYLPESREKITWRELPNGTKWYQHKVKSYTTTDLTPRQIHEIGLTEVERISSEMKKVMRQTGYQKDFKSFLHYLATDPQFYFTEEKALLQSFRDIAKRADPEMAKLFGFLPRTPYGILPVPAHSSKARPAAYYQQGSLKTGRPGYFYANTYDLPSRPTWQMEALTLHEAVPGHHHQISVAQEMEALPEFRKHDGYTAYVEGWGLYAESLGEEMGFYQDPYSKFGQLTFEMWRALRLVVDTGMHALGWSRQQAIDLFKEYTGKTDHEIIVEVDRYIVWPGQALAYKIGELKIKELRKRAMQQLGDRFDIRAFHDQILSFGAIPLNFLEELMISWIKQQTENIAAG